MKWVLLCLCLGVSHITAGKKKLSPPRPAPEYLGVMGRLSQNSEGEWVQKVDGVPVVINYESVEKIRKMSLSRSPSTSTEPSPRSTSGSFIIDADTDIFNTGPNE